MARLKVLTAGNPVLKMVSSPVNKIDKKIKRTLDDLAETMYKEDNGVGLAAPQCGFLLRMVVIDVGDEHGLMKLINPVITKREGKIIVGEGCLSVPDFEGEVERSSYVECEYFDIKGHKQFVAAEGLLAVCIQHELDHLDGILFTDRAISITPKVHDNAMADEAKKRADLHGPLAK
jgi:peptide deformylase